MIELLGAFFPVIIGAILALVAAHVSLRANRLQRLMSDMPTSKTSGVFIGFNEIKGRAIHTNPLTSHIAQQPCVYYSYHVSEHWSRTVTERYTDSHGRRRTRRRRESGWRTLDSGGKVTPFFVEDSHGAVLVRPSGAELEVPTIFSKTCSRRDPLYYQRGPRGAVRDSDHRRRFVEKAIVIGAPLYVLGQARERRDIVAAEIAVDPIAPKFLVSTRSEEQIAGGKGAGAVGLALLGAVFAGGGAFGYFASIGVEPVVWIIVFAVLVYFLLWTIFWGVHVTNSVIGLRNRVRQAFSLIEVQLKRRADLIPQLVGVIRGATAHEKDVQVVQVRLNEVRSGASDTMADYQRRSGKLVALAEAYPEITTAGNFLQLQKELGETEERIALARSYYNEMATFLNDRCQAFPDGLFAKIVGIRELDLYHITDDERASVEFDLAIDE